MEVSDQLTSKLEGVEAPHGVEAPTPRVVTAATITITAPVNDEEQDDYDAPSSPVVPLQVDAVPDARVVIPGQCSSVSTRGSISTPIPAGRVTSIPTPTELVTDAPTSADVTTEICIPKGQAICDVLTLTPVSHDSIPTRTDVQDFPLATSQAPTESSQIPTESLQAPLESSQAPMESSQAPLESSQAPVESSQAPTESSQAPLESLPPESEDSGFGSQPLAAECSEVTSEVSSVHKVC